MPIHIYENIHPQTQHDVAHRSLHLDTTQAPRRPGPVAATPTAAQSIDRSVQADAQAGPGRAPGVCHQKLPHRWWGPRHWKKLSTTLDTWLLGVLNKLRELILAMTNWRGWKRRFWRRSSTSRVPKVWAN